MNVARRALAPACATLAVVALLAAPARPAGAADGQNPVADAPAEMQFETYQLVLLVRPAQRPDIPEAEVEDIQRRHLAHLGQLAAAGKIVIAGPFGDQDDPRLRGLALYRVGSVEEARRLAEADPAVQAGRLEVEVMTWYVEKGYMTFPKAPPVAAAAPAP